CILVFLAALSGCVGTDRSGLVSDKGTYEQEYRDFLISIEERRLETKRLEAETLEEFLDRFGPVYAAYYRDAQLAEWFMVLGIGDGEKRAQAAKNRNALVNANARLFWKLRERTVFATYGQRRRAVLWEKVFEGDAPSNTGRGTAAIWNDIAEIEETILKNNTGDVRSLIDQEQQFVRLFELRNEYARARGATDHLHYMFSQRELNEYEAVYSMLRNMLPEEAVPARTVDGLVASSQLQAMDMMSQLVRGMGLHIDPYMIRYYLSTSYDYKRTFMTIIEPQHECRVYMYFPNAKLYPDEYQEMLASLVHETGHALHFQNIEVEQVIFNFFDFTLTETMAIFFENIIYKKEWLRDHFPRKLSEDEIELLVLNRRRSMTAFLRYALFLWEFEKAIYTDPTQDPEALYRKLADRINMPTHNRNKLWYDTTVFASHDLYYIHYTLAHVYAYQLDQLLEKKFGSNYYANAETGAFLAEHIMKYGRSRTPQEIFQELFGFPEPRVREYMEFLQR
ncbi:MAG TPA: hypothetical protein ENN69_06745, partial [Spirochaetia bacterium]|nr:hypothetical protein [Spirochaetia bacterium]